MLPNILDRRGAFPADAPIRTNSDVEGWRGRLFRSTADMRQVSCRLSYVSNPRATVRLSALDDLACQADSGVSTPIHR